MAIRIDKKKNIFYLETPNTSYIFGLEYGKLIHMHWGKRADFVPSAKNAVKFEGSGFSACDEGYYGVSSNELPIEFPTHGSTDYRYPAFHAMYEDGSTVTQFKYMGYDISKGKPKLEGLPSTYVNDESEADTLTITLKDELKGITAYLRYTAFNNVDAITKSVVIENDGSESIKLLRVMSSVVDFPDMDYDILNLHGTWAKERMIEKVPLMHGSQSVYSNRGSSSHHENPFIALLSKNATETSGDVYGTNLVYSGNFLAGAEVSPIDTTRMFIGLNPFNTGWLLKPGESFTAPEAVLAYSPCGLGGMSRIYHDLYRNNLCRGKYKNAERPVLINNWEATYFDFNEEKIVEIAKKAKDIGVEMFVLDDGWFGKRNDDHSSLGDWFVNKEKLPNGISGLSEKIEALGLKFGLWFEPEMISPVSELYDKHPDWCLHIDGRYRSESRQQLILDYSRKDVCDYITDTLSGIFSSAKISYVKWDMNRNMTEIGSAKLPPERQRETAHRYMLGLYHVLETLTSRFENILFESCSGGGGRFDPGMLYYMPQTWTSDNTDAIERCYIQYGTSVVYPQITMGAHVSAVPNHQVGRSTPMKTRCDIAMMGQFGFELDLNKLSAEEIETAKESIKTFKKLRPTVQFGDMYRLLSPFETRFAAWEFVSKDRNDVVLISCTSLIQMHERKLYKFMGLDENAMYVCEQTGEKYSGNALMNMGIFTSQTKDFETEVLTFHKEK